MVAVDIHNKCQQKRQNKRIKGTLEDKDTHKQINHGQADPGL